MLSRWPVNDLVKTPIAAARVNELERVNVAAVDANEPFRVGKLLNYHPAIGPCTHRIAAGHCIKRVRLALLW